MPTDNNTRERYQQQQRLHVNDEDRLLSPPSAKIPRQRMVHPSLQRRRRGDITDSNNASPPTPPSSAPHNNNLSRQMQQQQQQQLRYQEMMIQRRAAAANNVNLQQKQQQQSSSSNRDDLLDDFSSPQGFNNDTSSLNNDRYWQKEIFIPYEPSSLLRPKQQQQPQEQTRKSPLSPITRRHLINKLHYKNPTMMQNQHRVVRDLMARRRQQQQRHQQSSPVINRMASSAMHREQMDDNMMKRKRLEVYCNTCQGDASFLCSGCRKKWYCSRDCQVYYYHCFLFTF